MERFAANLEDAGSVEEAMGLEGAAAATYFRALADLIPEKWKFNGRNRRPPKDPVNSLLSLAYTLTAFEVRTAIYKKGLDPAPGFAHSVQEYRESLVLDIIEPLRPEADEFVLRLIRDSLVPSDFERTPGSVM